MTALRLSSRILALLSACALLVCGALAAAVVHWEPTLGWVAMVCFFVGMWSGR
jgi:CHASE2 domain-containing sensor protein